MCIRKLQPMQYTTLFNYKQTVLHEYFEQYDSILDPTFMQDRLVGLLVPGRDSFGVRDTLGRTTAILHSE